MSAKDVRAMLLQTGLPVAYRNWIGVDGAQPPPRPYLIYYEEGDDSLCADDGNYVQIVHWCAELYVDAKNEQLEKAVANAIASCELPYAKDEVGPTADDAPLLITYRFQTI